MAVISVTGSRLQTLLSPNFFRVGRSRLRSLKIGFWQHSDSDAISNRNRLLDANCLGRNLNISDISVSNAKVSISGRMKPRLQLNQDSSELPSWDIAEHGMAEQENCR